MHIVHEHALNTLDYKVLPTIPLDSDSRRCTLVNHTDKHDCSWAVYLGSDGIDAQQQERRPSTSLFDHVLQSTDRMQLKL